MRKELEDSEGDYEAIAERSIHKQQSDCVRTPEFIAKIREVIDPGKSIRSIARDLGRSESMIKTCVTKDLKYKSKYKM